MTRNPAKSGWLRNFAPSPCCAKSDCGDGGNEAKAHSCGRARLAFLLGGTAAIALLLYAKPSPAIIIRWDSKLLGQQQRLFQCGEH
jgi:hypothetical protein